MRNSGQKRQIKSVIGWRGGLSAIYAEFRSKTPNKSCYRVARWPGCFEAWVPLFMRNSGQKHQIKAVIGWRGGLFLTVASIKITNNQDFRGMVFVAGVDRVVPCCTLLYRVVPCCASAIRVARGVQVVIAPPERPLIRWSALSYGGARGRRTPGTWSHGGVGRRQTPGTWTPTPSHMPGPAVLCGQTVGPNHEKDIC